MDPPFQGRGIGGTLMDFAEEAARTGGAAELALDTSEHANALLSTYARRGYRHVETVQWPVTNYRSLVLSKTLQQTPVSVVNGPIEPKIKDVE